MASISKLLSLSSQLESISDTPQLDCELLLCHVIDKDRTWLRTWPDNTVSPTHQTLFKSLLDQRIKGTPIAYITGSRGFWSMDLNVSSDTLIPRPETELLVEIVLKLGLPSQACGLDLGTGSGAIALALASERLDMQWFAVDAQLGAVELAQDNCNQQQLSNVSIFQSNWFDAIKQQDNKFDLIVSNPPYIAKDDPHLSHGDVRFEPKTALVSGVDGLDDIKVIVSQSSMYLNTNGWLVLEHGYDQGKAVRDLMLFAGFNEVTTKQDYNNLDRITLGFWK
ncbi:MAG: peptide chain release factor N(5)-glutamine methyltransferase [Cellvibrionales bacterium TMED47]|nr:protein-(glutamine-N5) methyltransferase, release factor-specific [Porticoccaceae bacterium]RPG83212.1 MAG: peptide chain release factor N(5)-glutamine methyltransferase [Cellvibrionales bacterium TMED47]|tara:strand:+ start:10549 stop:11388 length:840 start_codon:yes stop_codon:yes gene_type:complete